MAKGSCFRHRKQDPLILSIFRQLSEAKQRTTRYAVNVIKLMAQYQEENQNSLIPL